MREEIKVILDWYLYILSKVINENFCTPPLNKIIITIQELEIIPSDCEEYIHIEISDDFYESEYNYFEERFKVLVENLEL